MLDIPRTKGRVKRAICRLRGHVPGQPVDVPNPHDQLTRFVACSRCGHLLSIEEVALGV
jgi:hypothetical protein